jgi:transposase
MAKPRFPLPELSASQRKQLQQWANRPSSAQALAMRARIILRLAEGRTSVEVAGHHRLHIQTVSKWRERFRQHGLDGLLDEPRPGQPRKITDAQVEEVITRTLESQSGDASHWSTRSMARASGLN